MRHFPRAHDKTPCGDSVCSSNLQPVRMSLPADYHMHTPLCRHAVGEPTELAAHAVRVGFTEIGFSDHNPMPRDDWDDWRMLRSDLDNYVAKVELAHANDLHAVSCHCRDYGPNFRNGNGGEELRH